MGVIKSALEIALEKTEKVKGDKSSINQFEARQRGKKLANSFMAGEAELAGEVGELALVRDRPRRRQGKPKTGHF